MRRGLAALATPSIAATFTGGSGVGVGAGVGVGLCAATARGRPRPTAPAAVSFRRSRRVLDIGLLRGSGGTCWE